MIIEKLRRPNEKKTCIFYYYLSRTEERALSRKEIIESVKDSLANLQLEYIDLLVIHKYDPQCPIEGKFGSMFYFVASSIEK